MRKFVSISIIVIVVIWLLFSINQTVTIPGRPECVIIESGSNVTMVTPNTQYMSWTTFTTDAGKKVCELTLDLVEMPDKEFVIRFTRPPGNITIWSTDGLGNNKTKKLKVLSCGLRLLLP